MALASFQEARSPVELSLNPVYHNQFSSIAKVLDHMRTGMKVWKRAYQTQTGGAPRVYGETYYLHTQSQYQTYKHPKTKEP